MVSRRFALVIGNSEYEDVTLSKLQGPEADVRGLAGLLRDPQVGGYNEVSELVDQPMLAVQLAISEFFREKRGDDLLLLYFSGHGVLNDRGILYLAARDTQSEHLNATAVAARFITEEMDQSMSRRQLLILDCCHSGAFARGTKSVGNSVGTAAAFEGNARGRVVMTAGDATQQAFDAGQVIGETDKSLFTHYLIQGLRTGEADLDGDGEITVDELYDYVYNQVRVETSKQTPRKWSYQQEGVLTLARSTRPVVPAELPEELLKALESSFRGAREAAVSELRRMLVESDRGRALAAKQGLEHVAEADDSSEVRRLAKEALQEQQVKELRTLLEQGLRAEEEEDWQAAIEAFQAVVDLNSEYEDAPAHLENARSQKRVEEERRAEELRSLYEESLRAEEEENWQVAIDALQAVVDLDSEFEDAKPRLEKAQSQKAGEEERRREELRSLYEQGLQAEEREDWPAAIEAFQAVVDLDSQYEDVAQRLENALAQEAKEKERRREELTSLHQQGLEAEEKEDWQAAIDAYQAVANLDSEYEDVAARLENAQAQKAGEEERRREELRSLYDEGLQAEETEAWQAAINAFNAVVDLDADYQDAAARLENARPRKRAEEQRRREELKSLYEQGLQAEEQEDWQAAIDAFQAVRDLDGEYEDTAARLENARAQKRVEDQRAELEDQYDRGTRAADAQRWEAARNAFQRVLDLDTGYRDASAQLKITEAHGKAEEQQSRAAKAQARSSLWRRIGIGSGIATLVLLAARPRNTVGECLGV